MNEAANLTTLTLTHDIIAPEVLPTKACADEPLYEQFPSKGSFMHTLVSKTTCNDRPNEHRPTISFAKLSGGRG